LRAEKNNARIVIVEKIAIKIIPNLIYIFADLSLLSIALLLIIYPSI
jgi:hypothetical protein